MDVVELLNVFARSITEWAKEVETASKEDDDNSEGGVEAEDKKTKKKGKTKPLQTIITTSWPSSRTSQSSLLELSRLHSLYTRTSTRSSGSVFGQT